MWRNQEQRLIPAEMPDGAVQLLWRTKPTTRGTSPHGDPGRGDSIAPWDASGCWYITGWEDFRGDQGSPLPPLPPAQLWMLLNTPFPPKTQILPSLCYSFCSQLQLPVPEPWDMGEDNLQPSNLGFRDGLCSWKSSATASPRQNAPEWGFGVFQGCFCKKKKKPCEGIKINQR